jgi:hypothetical protein
LYSTFGTTIFHLFILNDKSLFHLLINIFTYVSAGHFTRFINAERDVPLLTILLSTCNMISHAFNQDFSAGDHFMGDSMIIFHGSNSSIYAHIHSNFPFTLSVNSLALFFGKNTV